MTLKVERVESREAFERLGDLWDGFLVASGAWSPFLSHGWFRCCLDAYGEAQELHALVVRDGGTVVGLAPLWRSRARGRVRSLRRLGFITSPDTPYVDFVILEDRREEALRAIFDHLYRADRAEWDVLTLGQWPVESRNYQASSRLAAALGRRRHSTTSSLTPYIRIDGEWKDFLRTRSVRFRKTHRHVANRVRRLPRLAVRRFRDGDAPLFSQVLSVSARSWKHAEGIAMSSQPGARRFFEGLTAHASANGWLSVWLLTTGDLPIAMEYDLECDGTVYALRADFDESYAEYSPGAYLEHEIVRHVFEHGYREYSTGPGVRGYKLNWTQDLRENRVLRVYNDTLRGTLSLALDSGVSRCLRDLGRRALHARWPWASPA